MVQKGSRFKRAREKWVFEIVRKCLRTEGKRSKSQVVFNRGQRWGSDLTSSANLLWVIQKYYDFVFVGIGLCILGIAMLMVDAESVPRWLGFVVLLGACMVAWLASAIAAWLDRRSIPLASVEEIARNEFLAERLSVRLGSARAARVVLESLLRGSGVNLYSGTDEEAESAVVEHLAKHSEFCAHQLQRL